MLFDEMRKLIESEMGQTIISAQKIHIGYINNLYIIGFKDKNYILKIYNTNLCEEQILLSSDMQIRLSHEKLAPKIICFMSHTKPIFSIHEYIECTTVNTDEKYYYSIGFLLGKIHNNLFSYRSTYAKVLQQNDIRTYKSTNNGNLMSLGQEHLLESKIYYRIYDVIKIIIGIIRECGFARAYNYVNTFLSGYGKNIQLSKQEIKYMADIYAYTLSNDISCLEVNTYNLDEMYLEKRIDLHKFIISELKSIRSFINNLDYER